MLGQVIQGPGAVELASESVFPLTKHAQPSPDGTIGGGYRRPLFRMSRSNARSSGRIPDAMTGDRLIRPRIESLKTIFVIDNNGREAVKCAQTDSYQADDICPARYFAAFGAANHTIKGSRRKRKEEP